jgi:ferritin-like metal-binding protein YciE
VFERLRTPQEAYHFKLGAALKMENVVTSILESSIDEARDEQVAAAFRHHLEETRDHIRNVEEAFRLLGAELDDSPCPAIEGLMAEAKANAKMADPSIVDVILLQGAAEVEHHEIAVYENLIQGAEVMGENDVAAVLRRNLDNEAATLGNVRELHAQVAKVTPKDPPKPGLGERMKNAVGA